MTFICLYLLILKIKGVLIKNSVVFHVCTSFRENKMEDFFGGYAIQDELECNYCFDNMLVLPVMNLE